MRIQHNISALNAHRNLNFNNNSSAKSLEKLSSGYRINRAGDDAAGLAISEKMRAQINGLDQAQTNAQDGISMIQTAEGALNETHSILQRMRKLAVQSSNGTYTSEDRNKIQDEVNALTTELDRIAASTKFNGQTLANTENTAFKFQIGSENSVDQTLTVTINAMSATGLGVNSLTVSGTNATNANKAIDTIDSAIGEVNSQRSALGAAQNRLEHTINNLSVTEENLTASESRIRDVDMAKEMMSFTKNNILSQAAQAMLAQANTQPQGVLQLLQ